MRRSRLPPHRQHPPSRAAAQGEWGERVAEKHLREELPEGKRLRTVGRRVRVGRDEIDLVMEPADARRRPMTVFVEVKTRSTDAFGGGLAAVDRRKRRALCRAAARYMRKRPASPFRIDVVEVVGSSEDGRVDRVRHFENAVPMDRRWEIRGLARPGGGARRGFP